MNPLTAWLRRRREREARWREELDSHLAMRAEWNRANGVAEDQAEDLARRQFGGSLRALEAVRAVHISVWWESVFNDCRYALRGLRKWPVLSLFTIATIATGIGASTAIFSVVDPLLFRRLPYPKDHQLVSVGMLGPFDSNEFNLVSSYLDWRRSATPFQSLTAMRPASPCDMESGEVPRRLTCVAVERNFLKTLGIAPAPGRDFTPEDDRPGAPTVVLLSHTLWMGAFGGDPHALEKTFTLDEKPVRVIGVLPRSFEMPQLGDADVMLPARLDASQPRAANARVFLRTFARLRDGVEVAQARAAMAPLFAESLRTDVPAGLRSRVRLAVRSLRDRQIDEVKVASWMLLGAVLALLLLACVNVANLLIARATARRRELAMRAALGASRGRLARQMLTESLLLGLTGGAFGCGIGWALVRLWVRLSPEVMPRMEHAAVDLRVLAFALAASVAAAILFGMAPAFEQPRTETLAEWHAAGSRRMRLRGVLIVTQVAISLILLSGASLFLRSLWKLETQRLGFDTEHLMTASFTLNRHRYDTPAARAAFFDKVEERLKRISGGGAFALSDSVPPRGAMGRAYSNIGIVGRTPAVSDGGMVFYRWVSPGYFHAMRIPILAGRAFEESERGAGAAPVILSASLARRLFGNDNPIGQQVVVDNDGHGSPVVGVTADAKNNGIAVPPGEEYYRVRMYNSSELGRSGVAVLRTSLAPGELSRWLQREIAALDPAVPVVMATMEERIDRFRERPRFIAATVAGFAWFGLLLAAAGICGVLSFLVARQTREIGVRMALGARPMDIALGVQKRAGIWIAMGAVAGMAGALTLARAFRGLLFEISPADPASIVMPPVVLCLVGALAAWWPSRRAARVDPVTALRCE